MFWKGKSRCAADIHIYTKAGCRRVIHGEGSASNDWMGASNLSHIVRYIIGWNDIVSSHDETSGHQVLTLFEKMNGKPAQWFAPDSG